MPKPTQSQLDRINHRFADTPRTEENTFVFESLMIDDQPTSYSSKLHPSLLQKFMQDANRGVGLLMNHNHRSLPVGRSFGAQLRSDVSEQGELMTTLYGEFYIDLGRNTEGNMSTDDLAKGIDAGTIFDTSVGFNATKWDCSICGHDIRDYRNCSHMPGKTYQVEGNDGVHREEQCFVIAGADGKGELLENSVVYAGAAPRATITKTNFSVGDGVSDRKSEEGSTLFPVDTFKDIPLNATIYSFYSKGGEMVLYSDTDERTGGVAELQKRSESEVEFEKLTAVLGEFGLKFGTEDELKTALSSLSDKTELEGKLSAKEAEMTQTLAEKETELATALADALAKDEVITELTAKNEELSAKAGLGETYRADLETETVEYAVRVMGNAVNTELFTKFLSTLSVDEVKSQLNSFKEQHNQNFSGSRQTQAQEPLKDRTANGTATYLEDFESEDEFRDYVADKATEYAKENGVTLAVATREMFAKYSTKEAN
ncbi:hypothetical protein [Paenibacillus xylanexedens]|uniref:hypothetical protein n=1 Tax=Paenibacillus xylanexedens TaxID=528191 RepID=UPI0011A69B8D|nr:hypothetical protein [Paenibacillus xylanexedens]